MHRLLIRSPRSDYLAETDPGDIAVIIESEREDELTVTVFERARKITFIKHRVDQKKLLCIHADIKVISQGELLVFTENN